MILIFGGAYQGKLDYALKRFDLEEKNVFHCDMLDTLKLTICLMFTAITITSARAVDMPWWSTFVMLGLIFVPIVVYMVLLFRAR